MLNQYKKVFFIQRRIIIIELILSQAGVNPIESEKFSFLLKQEKISFELGRNNLTVSFYEDNYSKVMELLTEHIYNCTVRDVFTEEYVSIFDQEDIELESKINRAKGEYKRSFLYYHNLIKIMIDDCLWGREQISFQLKPFIHFSLQGLKKEIEKMFYHYLEPLPVDEVSIEIESKDFMGELSAYLLLRIGIEVIYEFNELSVDKNLRCFTSAGRELTLEFFEKVTDTKIDVQQNFYNKHYDQKMLDLLTVLTIAVQPFVTNTIKLSDQLSPFDIEVITKKLESLQILMETVFTLKKW